MKFETHVKNIIKNENQIVNFYNQEIVIYNVDNTYFLNIIAELKKLIQIISIQLKPRIIPPAPPKPIKVSSFEHVQDTFKTELIFNFKDRTSFFAASDKIQRYMGVKLPKLVSDYLNCISSPGNCVLKWLKNETPRTHPIPDKNISITIPYKVKKLKDNISYAIVENNTDINVNTSGGGGITK